MKLRYFSQIAKQCFLVNGMDLFYPFGGLETKPYIIHDKVTAQALYSKQLWFLRSCFGLLFFLQPVIFFVLPETFHNIIRLFLTFTGSILLCWFIHWLLFRKILVKKNRLPITISNQNISIKSIEKQNIICIFLAFLVSTVLLFCGIGIMVNGAIFVGWIAILFSEFWTLIWGYKFLLKELILHRKNPSTIKKRFLAAIEKQDAIEFESAIISAYEAEIPNELSEILASALPLPWHYRHEDIVQALQKIKDPSSVDVLFETAFVKYDYLAYDELFGLARKCTWALADIGTPEAKQRLENLAVCSNKLIAGYAKKRLKNWEKELPRKGKHVN